MSDDTLIIDLSNFISLEHNSMIKFVMRRWGVSLETAEDLMQDSYESCLLYPTAYTLYGSINQFVFGIVKKIIAKFFGTNKNPHSYTKEPEHGYEELTGKETIQEPPTEENILHKEPQVLLKQVRHFIKMRLPKQQNTIANTYIEIYMVVSNPDTEYVADILNVSRSNVNSAWSIITKKIRRHFG